MGYDCTLHAVDEKEISKKFVKTLLDGGKLKKNAAAEDREMWAQVLTSLTGDSPAEAAALVCQLALTLAARSHPYHYERGFALCLWPDQPDGLHATFPAELTASPEHLLAGLLPKYPQLQGQFPRAFDGNWSTGTYVPAKKIPAALKWVENQVSQYAEGDQRLFRGLLLVLRHCAENKLAYWEGTDLPVTGSIISLAGAAERRATRAFPWPGSHVKVLARAGSLFVLESGMAGSPADRTALANFSVWPPALQWLHEFAVDADLAADGQLVTVAAEPGKYFYTVRLRSAAAPDSPVRILSVPDPGILGENGYDGCRFYNGQVASMIIYKKGKTPPRHPLFQQGDTLQADHTFRPALDDYAPPDNPGYRTYESIRISVAKTGDRREIFIWDDHGYERTGPEPGAAWRATFSLAPRKHRFDWNSVPAGPDGFFYLANRQLHEIHRGSATQPHLPQLTNIMEIHPGPDGSLLLHEGDNKAGDWGKLYWPETKEFVCLKPDLVPDLESPSSLHWLADQRRLLVFDAREIWFVPGEELDSLPRKQVE